MSLLAASALTGKCVLDDFDEDSISKPIMGSVGGASFTMSNMSSPNVSEWRKLHEHLSAPWFVHGSSFGFADARHAPDLLFDGSKASGVFEKIPEQLRGVYWMKGDSVPKVLTVLQYGKWFPEQKVLLAPNAPFTWAWWGGSNLYPERKNLLGRLFSLRGSGKKLVESYIDEAKSKSTMSVIFQPCPAGAKCQEGSDDLSYARVAYHPGGSLSDQHKILMGGYTMEAILSNSSRAAGTHFLQRADIPCGALGEQAGFELVKVLDGNGVPVEPFHSEYLRFMGNEQLIVWSGSDNLVDGSQA